MNYIEITGKTVEEAISRGKEELAEKGLSFDRSTVVEEPSSGFLGFGKKDAKVRLYYVDLEHHTSAKDVVNAVSYGSDSETGNDVTPMDIEVTDEGDAPSENLHRHHSESIREELSHEPASVVEELEETSPKRTPRDNDESYDNNYNDDYDRPVLTPEKQSEIADKGKAFLTEMFENMGVSVVIEKMVNPERITYHVHGEDLGILIGKHGQTLDAIQYLTNLVANKGEGARCHIMVDVEGYRARREKTLQQLAHRLASKAKRNRHRVSLEPMNAYERKIIHMALQDTPHIKTTSEGEGTHRHIVIEYVK